MRERYFKHLKDMTTHECDSEVLSLSMQMFDVYRHYPNLVVSAALELSLKTLCFEDRSLLAIIKEGIASLPDK